MSDLPAPIEEAITRYAAEQRLDRDEAVERILHEWLSSHGYLHAAADEGRHPEDLNASNDG